jgi:biotin operon repressor
VKLSTAFKPHIKEIRGAPLAVWLYISLCVNKQGVSFPSINKIAEDTGYSRNGVMDAINVLENKGYMKVRRGEIRYNLYEPEFAAIGRNNEPSDESTQLTSPVSKPDESTFPANESSVLDSNKRNKRKQDAATPQSSETEKAIQDLSIENQIFLGKLKVQHSRTDQIKNALREYFRLTPRWVSKFDKQWIEWALDEEITPEQIKCAAELWRSDKRFNWAVASLKGIAEHWLELIETQQSEDRPEYKPFKSDDDDLEFVARPK